MSVTTLLVSVSSNYSLKVSAIPFGGSDWGNTTLAPGTIIPPGTTAYQVGQIGDPGVAETNHWGWLYFWAIPTGGGISFPIQLYINEGHSNIVAASAGYYDSCSNEGNPMPSGTIGSTTINTEPPGGKVTYSIS